MNSEEDEFRRIEAEALRLKVKRTALAAQPQQQAEPVAYLCENGVGHRYFRWKKPLEIYKPIGLYTAPPQRTWVGLTEDEAFACKGRDYFATYRAIEQVLKQRNI